MRVMGKYGVRERNEEGQRIVDFAKRMDMAVLNTYFKNKEEHRVTYQSGSRCTQVDYVLCRRSQLKVGDCKVFAGVCCKTTSDGDWQDDLDCEPQSESEE